MVSFANEAGGVGTTLQVQQALTEGRQWLGTMYGDRLRRVVLFGSQARCDTGPERDADVLVVLEGPVDFYRETRRLADVSVLGRNTIIGLLSIMLAVPEHRGDGGSVLPMRHTPHLEYGQEVRC